VHDLFPLDGDVLNITPIIPCEVDDGKECLCYDSQFTFASGEPLALLT
jgi:hypothetical protein